MITDVLTDIEYPESDGRPMGETDLHRKWMIRVYDLLAHRYRGRRVYVGSDLLVYNEEGNPKKFVVPDDFVVLDCEPGDRRVFKIWEEERVPNVVVEITSRKTKKEDTKQKPGRYAKIGVGELFLYEPTHDYLPKPLLGYRLVDGRFEPIEPDENGALLSDELDLLLKLDDDQLVMLDQPTGQLLETAEEQFERQAAEHDAARQREAEARQAAEAEVRRLRDLLNRQRGNGE